MSTLPLFHVVVCAAIAKDGKILLARRKAEKKLGGMWEFPGGKLEPQESLADALARELREELSITAPIRQLLHVEPYHYPHGDVLILFYLCDYKDGELTLVDHDQIKWCHIDEIADLPLLPANARAIEALKLALTSSS